MQSGQFIRQFHSLAKPIRSPDFLIDQLTIIAGV
jgi:hypothetical protein